MFKKNVMKLIFLLGVFGMLFSGCVVVHEHHDRYESYVYLYVSDTVVYDHGHTYQALYAELVGERVYSYQSFLLEEDREYRLDYAYEMDGEVYVTHTYIRIDDDMDITLRGNELIMEYYY